MANRHGWNSWDQYQNAHYSRLRDFEHFIIRDDLTFLVADTLVHWEGVLYCADGIEIKVAKVQHVRNRHDGQPEVQTFDYSYQVMQRRGDQVCGIFRYDNAHHFIHPDPHHRHQYDEQCKQIEPAQPVGEDGWPTLGDVIQEAHDWWVAQQAQE